MRSRVSWLVPDIALVASLVTLFYCLFLFDGPRKLFRDSDSGWHIRTGEGILATGRLPRTDSYSFTRTGASWFAWEWASDVLMGAVHREAGLGGVAALYAIAIAASVWLWFRLHWAAGGDFFIACAMASPMLSTANLHWLARPHVFGWLFLLMLLWYMERAGNRTRAETSGNGSASGSLGSADTSVCATGAIMAGGTALWANVHASFFLAPGIALVYAVSHAARPLLWELDRRVEWAKARWYLMAAAFAAVGSLATPYGWNLHVHVARYLADGELLSRVGEFQSFNFQAAGTFQILLTLLLAGLGGVLALSEKKVAHFLLAAILIAAALRSARGLPLVALAVLPLANGSITEALKRSRNLAPAFKRGLEAFLSYSRRLRVLDAGLGGYALAPVAALAAFLWMQLPAVAARTGFPPDQFPVAAAAELEKLPEGIRLLAPDKFGGYLIYRFAGKRKVFFDGRSDFYGTEFMKQYGRMMQLRPGWREQVRGFGFTHALLPSDYPLADGLEQLGWQRLYRDRVATLLARP